MNVTVLCCVCGTAFVRSKHFIVYECGGIYVCAACKKASRKPVDDQGRITFQRYAVYMHGCALVECASGRCDLSYTCEHYEECLSKAESMSWSGWTTIGGGECSKN